MCGSKEAVSCSVGDWPNGCICSLVGEPSSPESGLVIPFAQLMGPWTNAELIVLPAPLER